jgi:Zn-dependent protease
VESGFGPDFVVLGVAWYVVLLFSLTVHEAAHAFAALRGGDQTAYLGGQASLAPLPHIRREPLGTLVFPVISYVLSSGGWMFGWASTPIDPVWARAHPRRAAWMALAGPAANLGLALAAGVALRVGIETGVFRAEPFDFEHLVGAQGGVGEAAGTILSILFTLNLVLLVFNLFPVPPLDGASAVQLVLPAAAARRLREWFASPPLALGGILLVWWVFPRIFGPIHAVALSVLYGGAF